MRHLISSLLVVAVMLGAVGARAEIEPDADRSDTLRASTPRRFALEANVLAPIGGRYSVNVEWVAVAHHAIVLTPFAMKMNAGVLPDSARDFSFAAGAELGYRYYTGTRGPHGFFVGPSFGVAWAEGIPLRNRPAMYIPGEPTTTNGLVQLVGLDAGAQTFFADGWLVGAGAGAQLMFDGQGGILRPRVLLALGHAW